MGEEDKRKMYDKTGMTGHEQEQADQQGFGGFGFNPFSNNISSINEFVGFWSPFGGK